jgi:hypothetical protein
MCVADLAASLVLRYAKQSLNALPATEQADLLGWAEAHAILSALFRERVLHRLAVRNPKHWEGEWIRTEAQPTPPHSRRTPRQRSRTSPAIS